jgi:hypothetical protein
MSFRNIQKNGRNKIGIIPIALRVELACNTFKVRTSGGK